METQTGTGSGIRPKTIKDDERVTKLLAEGWRFHSNYDPKVSGRLEEVLHISDSYYYHPQNAREILIIDVAYDVFGGLVPAYNAVYMRNFREPKRPQTQ